MSAESTTIIVIRYGLNTGQIVEVISMDYMDTVDAMETIQWIMKNEKFVEHDNTMVLCEAIISLEIIEK